MDWVKYADTAQEAFQRLQEAHDDAQEGGYDPDRQSIALLGAALLVSMGLTEVAIAIHSVADAIRENH